MHQTTKKTTFVARLTAGQPFQDLFLVARKSLAETKAGKPYLALTLMDRTGEVEARIWDHALQFDAEAEEGAFVLVQAVAKPFRDQMQLAVHALQRVADGEVDPADFMPASQRPLAEMAAELDAVITAIDDPPLRALLQALFSGATLTSFQRAPAAKKLHHAYIGGLIEHSLSMVGMAQRAAAHYPLVDRNMLVAGALVHDLAKIEEFDWSRPAFRYTDRGRLVGHLVLGVDLVRRAAAQVADITEEQVDRLVHIILSHHGQYAYGSPVLPMTPEAILLHHLDDIDAKMNYMAGLQAKMQSEGWQWTDYQRHLERFLYLRGGQGEEVADAMYGTEAAAESGVEPLDLEPSSGLAPSPTPDVVLSPDVPLSAEPPLPPEPPEYLEDPASQDLSAYTAPDLLPPSPQDQPATSLEAADDDKAAQRQRSLF